MKLPSPPLLLLSIGLLAGPALADDCTDMPDMAGCPGAKSGAFRAESAPNPSDQGDEGDKDKGSGGGYNPGVQPTQPCPDNPGSERCYSPDQVAKIHDDLSKRYDDLDGLPDRIFSNSKVKTDPNIAPDDVNGLVHYLDTEEKAREFLKQIHQDSGDGGASKGQLRAQMHDIQAGRQRGQGDWIGSLSPDQRAELLQLRGQLHQAMDKLVPTDFHDAVMGSGDKIAERAMGGSTMPGHDWPNQQPNNPAAYNYAAQNELQDGDASAAAQDYSKAISLDPNNAQALLGRSEANYMLKDLSGAARDAKATLQLDPGNAQARQIYALSQGRSVGGAPSAGNPFGAAQGSQGGEAGGGSGGGLAMQDPASGQSAAAALDARSAMKMGDFGGAVAAASRAITLNSSNADAYNLRAIAYNRSHQFALALKDAITGLQLAPKNVALLLAKAVALNRLHRYAEAEAAARQALELDPNNAQAYEQLAMALAGQHNNQGAIAALRAAAQLDPRYADKLRQALQLPEASDLSFLFPDDDAAGGKKDALASPADRARRFKIIAATSIAGGGLLALGLLSLFLPKLKEAWTRATRSGPAVTEVLPMPTPPARQASRSVAEGGLLRGQYQVVRQIGIGGMGLVYEGKDTTLQRPVAIKKMRDEIRLERRERERFVSEAKVVGGLHHPSIVDIYAIIEENDDVYLVFEYIKGRTLHDIVHGSGPLPFGRAVSVLKSVADALDYAHSKNIIHRDLKPGNIMVSDDGRTKVMDFGIARVAKDAMAHYSMTNTVVGTPPYMAPEQEQGVVRRESDVYALAICLYEMLCGKLPFNGSGSGMLMNKLNLSYVPVSRAVNGLPRGIDDVFARAFNPDPEKRFHGAKELVGALDALEAPVRHA